MTTAPTHTFFMQRCFELAKLGGKETKKNPTVGAVLVHKNKIIGEGYHKKYGAAHAEINAIHSVKDTHKHLIPDASIYISLEPCFHQGKTPPCVDAIIQHGIKNVYISTLDPFEKVAGQSITKLKEHGVHVESQILEQEGKDLIKKFIVNTIDKRSYVILKFAQSKDGFIGKESEAVWLTNSYSKTLSHKWRSEVDGILVGTQTAIIDNPKLNTRLYSGDSPKRIVLDRQERIPKSHQLLSDEFPTLIFTTKASYKAPANKQVIVLNEWALEHILKAAYENEIYSLIIEGGKSVLDSFIKANLWDEYRIFTTDTILGSGIKAPILHGLETRHLRLGMDQISYGYPKYY